MKPTPMSRREFLKESSLAATGLAVAASSPLAFAADAKPEERNKQAGMRYRVLGRTNLLVSELSLGGVGLQAAILEAALDKGVNLVHVADAYKGCLPEAAKVVKTKRAKMFIAAKSIGTVEQVDAWLKTLETDHVDIIMQPISAAAGAKDNAAQVKEKFEALKKAGKARFLGITCHSNVEEVTRAAVEAGVWDVINPQYGPPMREKLDPILAEAKKKNLGMVAMKAFAGAKDIKPEVALKTALANKNMDSVWKGISSVQMLDTLVKAVNEPLTARERDEFWRQVAAQRSSTCAMCSACLGCPRGVAIEEILRCSLYYQQQLRQPDYARAVYHQLSSAQTPANCADCGRCEKVCPNRLPVRQLLRDAHQALA